MKNMSLYGVEECCISPPSLFLSVLQCLTPDKALSVLEDDGKADLSEDDYQQISTLLLYYIVNLEDLCSSNATSLSSSFISSFENDQFYILALTSFHPNEDTNFLSSSEIESILQLINQHYHPSNQDNSQDLQVGWENISVLKLARRLMMISDPVVCWGHQPPSRSRCRRACRRWSVLGAQTGRSHCHSYCAGPLFQKLEPSIPHVLHRLYLWIPKSLQRSPINR